MKKNLLALSVALMATFSAKAQVGINNPTPLSTLDIKALNPTGTTANVEGLLIPRVDRQKAQNMKNIPTSTLIYIDNISSGSQVGITTNVDAVGYYYFNGLVWTKLKDSVNIYNSDGSLTGNRIVNMGSNTLSFTSTPTSGTQHFSVDGNTLSVDAVNNRVGIDTATPSAKLDVNGNVIIRNVQAGDLNTDYTLFITPTGEVRKGKPLAPTLSEIGVPRVSVFKSGAMTNFLQGVGNGGDQQVPWTTVNNNISDLVLNPNYSFTVTPGTYLFSLTYFGDTTNSSTCTLSSYFVDFPIPGGSERLHSNVSHNPGGTSNHGGTFNYSTVLTTNRTFFLKVGRGQAGNCGVDGANLSFQLAITKFN